MIIKSISKTKTKLKPFSQTEGDENPPPKFGL